MIKFNINKDGFWSAGLFKYLVLELIISLIHSPPKVNKIYQIAELSLLIYKNI